MKNKIWAILFSLSTKCISFPLIEKKREYFPYFGAVLWWRWWSRDTTKKPECEIIITAKAAKKKKKQTENYIKNKERETLM